MADILRIVAAISCFSSVGCRPSARDPERDRAVALKAAQDTAGQRWQHEVGVDSVQMRGNTTVVWVSPRNWMATDAPQASVRVLAGGRVVGIRWILGG
jgi:hypothetical protein